MRRVGVKRLSTPNQSIGSKAIKRVFIGSKNRFEGGSKMGLPPPVQRMVQKAPYDTMAARNGIVEGPLGK